MKNHQTKLIEGIFSPIKAKNLLLELFNYKIDFHKNEKLSNHLRFGNDKEQSENRIKALLVEKKHLVEWLENLDDSETLAINCNINIEKLS